MIEVKQVFSAHSLIHEIGDLLYQQEAVYNLLLGLCEGLADNSIPIKTSPFFLRIVQDGKNVAAAVQTPPANLVMSTANELQIKALATKLNDLGAQLPGVVASTETCENFAQNWAMLTGKSIAIGMAQKIYVLKQVIMPQGPGHMRVAQQTDLDLVAQWMCDFCRESLPPHEHLTFEQSLERARQVLNRRSRALWIIDDTPVAMANWTRPTKNGVCINGVYTPPTFRKKGYASLLVAHLSQSVLDSRKKYCCLYTDASNPTSNRIYQNIGYKEVAQSLHLLFV